MLPIVLIGMLVAPVFAFIEWQQGDFVSMIGDALLTGVLMTALVLLLTDSGFDVAARFCIGGLLINWALLAPFGGSTVDHLLFLWWPIFPLIVFFLMPSKSESRFWFAGFIMLLIIEGFLFEYSGRMASDSLPYWSAVFITLFAGYVVSHWLDVTTLYRQHLEEGRRELQEQAELQEIMARELVQAKKLEEIGLMAGGIAHDFNNLLSIIIGHTEVLHHEVENLNDDMAESLKMISLGATRGANLARELLAFAGKAEFESGPVYLDRIAHDMTILQRSHLSRQIEVQLDIRPVPALTGDSTPFEQMVLNLVRNAIDAMEGRPGRLEVGTDLVELDGKAITNLDLFAGPGPGRYVRLWVCDEGCGIRDEERLKIFDAFFTTKKRGSGLGLASLLNHVRRYSGGLQLESEYGQGTCFTLYFPLPDVEQPRQEHPVREDGISGEFEVVRP